MDTDDLSLETYEAVLITAERFHHDLTLQFGILAGQCRTDDEYLDLADVKIQGWMRFKDKKELIEHLFFDDPPGKQAFQQALTDISGKILQVRKIPAEKRKFEIW